MEKPDLVVEWRKATRHAFIEAMTLGYVVEEFYPCITRRLESPDLPPDLLLLVSPPLFLCEPVIAASSGAMT